jgi:succinate dehydrogenase/fumarate reductase cytochrome b subunit
VPVFGSYHRRFKIETLFKQMKSADFNLQKSKVSGKTWVSYLILVVDLAFLFTFCIGIVLKLMPVEHVKTFTRTDRYQKLSPITLAIRCLRANENLVKNIFSNLSKNWALFSITTLEKTV